MFTVSEPLLKNGAGILGKKLIKKEDAKNEHADQQSGLSTIN